jgi:hypothetical protein
MRDSETLNKATYDVAKANHDIAGHHHLQSLRRVPGMINAALLRDCGPIVGPAPLN